MPRLIVFDSVDMTGKTTIAHALAEKLNMDVFKFSREHERNIDFMNMLMYTAECQMQMVEQTRLSIIFDRFVASEWVYSKLYNRYTCEAKIWDLDARMAALGGIYVYCFKTPENYEDDDLGLTKTEDYSKLERLYWEFFDRSKCKVIKICTDDYDTESQIGRILNTGKALEIL